MECIPCLTLILAKCPTAALPQIRGRCLPTALRPANPSASGANSGETTQDKLAVARSASKVSVRFSPLSRSLNGLADRLAQDLKGHS